MTWAPNKITIRTFISPRIFNLLFSIEDLQGDGFVRITFGVFYRSVQLIIPFDNQWGYQLDWRLFRSKQKDK